MRRRMLIALALPWVAGCTREKPAQEPVSAINMYKPSLTIGCRAILYDPDPSSTTVFAWRGDRKHFETPEIGTSVLYLGELPPRDGAPEARVKVLDGELKDILLFVPARNVQPDGPIQDPSAGFSP